MDQYSDEHVISGTAELAIGFLSCFLIVALIILRLATVGPLGGHGPASHAGAGFGEIALILGVICLCITTTFTRLVYRTSPKRWLKIASVLYLVMLVMWIGFGFIETGGALLMIALQLLVGVACSIILMAHSLVTRLRP